MPEVLEFSNVTLYRSGMFGVSAITCKFVKVITGVKYAQYENAVRVEYLEKGRRKTQGRYFILDYEPWLRVVESSVAIEPADPMVECKGEFAGGSISRYTSHDPRYVTDFEDALMTAGNIPVLLAIGHGEREICMRCTHAIATTNESGSHVCGPCANAIRHENELSREVR